jgi:hypothetical protein
MSSAGVDMLMEKAPMSTAPERGRKWLKNGRKWLDFRGRAVTILLLLF